MRMLNRIRKLADKVRRSFWAARLQWRGVPSFMGGATNRVKEKATRLSLPVPDGTLSGDPLVIGELPCVAVVDRSEWTPGSASVQTDGSFSFPVKAEGPGGNEAISVGEIVYIDTDGEMNTDETNGKRFGYALEAIDSGDTETIEVKVGY